MTPKRRYRQYKQRLSKNPCSAAGLPRIGPWDHYYIVRCIDCPEWVEHHNGKPLSAAQHACEHAYHHADHTAYVINLNQLTVARRYQFVSMLEAKDPTDEPPF